MKPILTPQQAAELDRATQARGIPADVLMERAGWAVARAVADLTGGIYGRRAVVVCGRGNNGGDGLVAARHLARWGMRPAVVLLAEPERFRDPAAVHLDRLRNQPSARIRSFGEAGLARELDRADVAVDAVFGTGFHGVATGDEREAIRALNAAGLPVVAVDIPSGVDGATGAVEGEAVWAELTVTFGAAKVGAVSMPGAERAGDVRVIDIGFPEELLPTATGLTEPEDVARVLPTRVSDGHKKGSGTLVVVAGSRAMTGAVRMIARGAERLGAGYVIVAVPASILPAVQAGLTETIFLPLRETREGTVAASALDTVLERASDADALAIGPGLSTQTETQGFIRDLVRDAPVPFVLDADGLNAFTGEAEALADRKADAVLTPHLGELARLGGAGDRLTAARGLTERTHAVAVVKGTRTVVAEAGGAARINPTGSAFLATAGTGDVLTGAIAGLLARGLDPFEAAWAGVYLHGLAGIFAGRDLGEGAVAGDVADRLPAAVDTVREQAGG